MVERYLETTPKVESFSYAKEKRRLQLNSSVNLVRTSLLFLHTLSDT
ncbi:hypothetical protein [Mechercharimyces sp. CAU 1602]|nr:hypothetical protein [Mechercharimyces sp. CAU 1602]MCS1351665.1 hypothetical protein [Mechercharimyces sp. CAU 1602]